MVEPKTILITGASSGLGKALAIEYATENTTLFLTGRDENRLLEVVNICKKKQAKVFYKALDIKNKNECDTWFGSFINEYNFDLIIANAGISAGTAGGIENETQIYDIFNTNIFGVLNTITPFIEKMKQQKSGQIAIISSMASFRGMPSAPSYSATKACVRLYAEALNGYLQKYNINVCTVCPGFIKTPLTDKNNFKMPFLMTSEKAVTIIKIQLLKRKKIIIFPKIIYYVIKIIDSLPFGLNDYFFNKLPKK